MILSHERHSDAENPLSDLAPALHRCVGGGEGGGEDYVVPPLVLVLDLSRLGGGGGCGSRGSSSDSSCDNPDHECDNTDKDNETAPTDLNDLLDEEGSRLEYKKSSVGRSLQRAVEKLHLKKVGCCANRAATQQLPRTTTPPPPALHSRYCTSTPTSPHCSLRPPRLSRIRLPSWLRARGTLKFYATSRRTTHACRKSSISRAASHHFPTKSLDHPATAPPLPYDPLNPATSPTTPDASCCSRRC